MVQFPSLHSPLVDPDSERLDRVFGALSDRVRRGVITRLAAGPVAVSELAEAAGMTVTGMAKHLRLLEDVGLVATEKVGRTRMCRVGSEPLDRAMAWIDLYQKLWQRRFDGLDAYFTTANADAAAPANSATDPTKPAVTKAAPTNSKTQGLR